VTLYPGHIIKTGEPDASLVRAIVAQLRALGVATTSPDGVYDDAVASAVKAFQSQHVDPAMRPLTADGQIGPLTWGALFGTPPSNAIAQGLAGAALKKAEAEIGVMEDPPGSNSGPMVDKFLASAGAGPGDSWCMAFVHWCFEQAAHDLGAPNIFPRTAGCLDAWAKVSAASPQRVVTAAAAKTDPSLVKPGFVFILDHGHGHGHTGFVSATAGGALRTVEGNSNDNGSANGVGVFALNRRSVMEADLKGFLDFSS
jgi:hypothetical protein